MKKFGLLIKLLLGIFLGVSIGGLCSTFNILFVVRLLVTFNAIFGSFLSFIIPLVIIGFVAPGISDLGKRANGLLIKTVGISYVSSVLAGLFAFIIGNLLVANSLVPSSIKVSDNINDIQAYFSIEMGSVMGVMTSLVFAFLLGIGMAHLKGKNLKNVMDDFQQIITATIGKVLIPLIPLHICGIFAKITAEGKILSTVKLFAVIFTAIIILQLLYLFILYALMFFYAKKNPFKAFRNMLPAYFAALGTQSSAATIPITLECAKNNGVREEVSDFVIPLCATIHLAGDTVTLVLGAMGIMAMHGMQTSFSFMLPYILMLGVTMVAAPGIPGGGVMAALGLLEKMLGFGQAQQSLMIALHFSQDSFGTATNVTGDGAIVLVVDKIYEKQDH